MVSQALLIRLMAVAAVVQAAPLNINLGAYSPALVVGDGAIEFEGGEGGRGVENVVNALQGSRVSGGAAPVAEAPVVAQAQVAEPILREAASLPIPGSKKELDPRVKEQADAAKVKARDIAGFDRALKFAETALEKGPKVQLGTGEAGVGIIVDNNQEAAARPGTGVAE